MNAPPPCAAACPGNRRKFPNPTADPETARMTPTRVPHSICRFRSFMCAGRSKHNHANSCNQIHRVVTLIAICLAEVQVRNGPDRGGASIFSVSQCRCNCARAGYGLKHGLSMKPLTRYILVPFLFALAGIFATAANAQDIVVGEFASLTGSEATFGVNSSNGIELAKEEVNNAGGVLGGRRIKIILEDDQSRPGQPSAAVKKLIANDKVVAVLGEIASSRSLEAGPICQAAKVPMVSPGATNPRVTETGDYVFRVCFIDTFQGTVMAKFTLDTLHANKIAIMTDVRNDYSVGLTKYFKEYYESHGGKVVAERSFSGSGTDRDFRAQLTAIKATQP